jgi:hypothetical protein
MEAIRSSETSGTTLRTTRRPIPEDDTLQNHRCENLKSCKILLASQEAVCSTKWVIRLQLLYLCRAYIICVVSRLQIFRISGSQLVMKSSTFWNITPCSLLEVNRRFGEICRLAYFSTLKTETTCSSGTSVGFQRTTRRYSPEDRTLYWFLV